MRREPTDRVVTVYKGTEEVDQQLMDYFSVSGIDELLIALGADYNHFPFVGIRADDFERQKEDEDGLFRDIWGVGRRYINYDKGRYQNNQH